MSVLQAVRRGEGQKEERVCETWTRNKEEEGEGLMADCRHCKYAVWDELEYYPHARVCYVEDCELGNGEEDCEDFEEYDGDYE